MGERGCWVYGVTDTEPAGLGDLGDVPGVAGGAVRAVPAGPLTAVVSDVDLDEFGADALARNLEDLDWLERVARAHHHVIEAAWRRAPVLPVGLTTVYSGEPSMAEALGARRRELTDALAVIRGRAEWGVKAYPQPRQTQPDYPERTSGDSGAAPGSGAGLAYLKRRRERLNADRDSRRDAAEAARALHQALAARAAGARLHPPQSPRLTRADAPMLLNAAYLLDAGQAGFPDTGFPDTVAAEAAARPELRVEVTGPWPPYSFAGPGREETTVREAGS
ncbi:MAG: GvpL/GvpF family gas vesicle protein [Nocardiopsaceae bacterium]|nr:GvpL/GvpF family gas vesicle protein [Nocardiopsaceae bacterium]